MKDSIFKSNSEATSNRMRMVRSQGTKLEASMERILMQMNLQYVKQPNLTGHPDFQLVGRRILIFCDSSFWHGRNPDDLSGRSFKRNRDLWVKKLTRTRQRDKEINMKLRGEGWNVIRFWDSEILKHPEKCEEKLMKKLKID